MITRKTSLEAYNHVRNSGHVGRMQWLIYDCMYRYGPLTITECFKRIEAELAGRGERFNYNTRTRFGELRDMGLIYETGERICSSSGRKVLEFDVTDLHSPKSLPSKISKNKRLKDLLHTYVRNYPNSCGCSIHGRDQCLFHQSIDAIGSK